MRITAGFVATLPVELGSTRRSALVFTASELGEFEDAVRTRGAPSLTGDATTKEAGFAGCVGFAIEGAGREAAGPSFLWGDPADAELGVELDVFAAKPGGAVFVRITGLA